MHLLLAVFAVGAMYRFANPRRWEAFHGTILYMAFCSVMYSFLTDDYPLWKYEKSLYFNQHLADLLYAVITLPAVTLIYLQRYPEGSLGRQVWYNVKWILGFTFLEYVMWQLNVITYHHRWNLLWSFFFVCVMFPMLRVHYRRPGVAYALTPVFAAIWLILFRVPFWINH